MRYRFEPVDQPSSERLLESIDRFERAGDRVAALLMPVYLGLVALVSWSDGFSWLSVVAAVTVGVNCWPAARGLRALRVARAQRLTHQA